MAVVIDRITKQIYERADISDTPDHPTKYPLSNYAVIASKTVFQDVAAIKAIPQIYRKIEPDDTVIEMTPGEKIAVDTQRQSDIVNFRRAFAALLPDEASEIGVHVRALIELMNKRDNYLTNRVIELQDALTAMKASTGAVQNLRDAIPPTFSATQTRPRSDAVTDYKNNINAGVVD